MSKTKTIIRTSRHEFVHANVSKRKELNSFINECRRVAKVYLDHLWQKGIDLIHNNRQTGTTSHYSFDSNTHLDCPGMLSTVEIDKATSLDSWLTSRARKCCMTQMLGIVRSATEKQRKRQFVANEKRSQHSKIPRKLRKCLRQNKPTKPDVSDMNPEINSLCLDFQQDDRHFDGWLRLSSFDNRKRNHSLKFPFKFHRHSRCLQQRGQLMTSFLLRDNIADLRWETEKKGKNKRTKKTVGADQGLKTVLFLSDGQSTPDADKHGHSLESIIRKISRKQRGSKAMGKARDHRKNFIHWSINQLNLSGIKRLRLENVKHLRRGKRSSRLMSHWTYALIRDKVEQRCQEEEVLLSFSSPTFRSQRCSQCGLVLKSNRHGKVFSCKNCGCEMDADWNASCNHQQDLPDVPWDLRRRRMNLKGFFWKPSGFHSLVGEELAVPLPKNE